MPCRFANIKQVIENCTQHYHASLEPWAKSQYNFHCNVTYDLDIYRCPISRPQVLDYAAAYPPNTLNPECPTCEKENSESLVYSKRSKINQDESISSCPHKIQPRSPAPNQSINLTTNLNEIPKNKRQKQAHSNKNYCTHTRNPNGRLTDPSHPRSTPQRHTTRRTNLTNAPEDKNHGCPTASRLPIPPQAPPRT
ncbi:hypothetical protein PCH_Pc21g06140 [Penicillium rubens Wisconsin 54-1255]|uniref:Uncharacterized protein n=1 Tax=Penicillium rubens (strain ATCC 28089 / DSM 1075 / NRRL 1951 / Wisconsin 54-1255) TaxID=500485 RepID=B6HIV7_PENRW|nr:hypothetical protein PCH_Pc21g06140 [Penicillium rubens Wisconsin 54-1255]